MAYFLMLNQSPYPRFEAPKTDSQGHNDNSQSPQQDSLAHEIGFQRRKIDNQSPNSLYRGQKSTCRGQTLTLGDPKSSNRGLKIASWISKVDS